MEKEKIQQYYEKISKDVISQGILLNPDTEFTMDLVEGILTNRERFGEDYCPCRLPTGNKDIDADIICPCIFRDDDISDYGACFCALFVSKDWGTSDSVEQIPERWNRKGKKPAYSDDKFQKISGDNQSDINHEKTHEMLSFTLGGAKVWFCKVCGYMAFREKPPAVCPVCKVGKEKFELIEFIVRK